MVTDYASLFNLTLKTGNVPEQWTIGKIKPIYKNKGDSLDPSNYQPITILSCLGKLFTVVLNDRLCNFLDDNNLLNDNYSSCQTELFTACIIKGLVSSKYRSIYGNNYVTEVLDIPVKMSL